MKPLKIWAGAAWGVLAAAAIGMKIGNISLHVLDRWPLCPFRFWTGHPCPGCGMTHALLAAFQGQWKLSFGFHPLGIPLLIVWTGWLLGSSYIPHSWSASDGIKKLKPWMEGLALAAIAVCYTIRMK